MEGVACRVAAVSPAGCTCVVTCLGNERGRAADEWSLQVVQAWPLIAWSRLLVETDLILLRHGFGSRHQWCR